MLGVVTTLVRSQPDAVAAAAVDEARSALAAEVGPSDVGEHLGVEAEGERVVTHPFACERKGYLGWHWAVTSPGRHARSASPSTRSC